MLKYFKFGQNVWRHKKKLNLETKKILHESFVRCHITYCLAVWGSAAQNSLQQLNKNLKKVWRDMSSGKQHTLNRLQKLKVLKLEDELQIKEQLLVWSWEKNNIPTSLKTLLVKAMRNYFFFSNSLSK
jgi:hypothetical protein